MMKPEVIALRSVMKEKGLNQSELARLANCSTTYVSRILGGSAPFGRIAQEKMFAALDVPEDEVRRRGEGAKNKSPVAGLPVAAPEFIALAQEEIGLQMIPINEKNSNSNFVDLSDFLGFPNRQISESITM